MDINDVQYFLARDIRNAREIAKRIVTEGMWTTCEEAGEEVFYPTHRIYKVKIEKVK